MPICRILMDMSQVKGQGIELRGRGEFVICYVVM